MKTSDERLTHYDCIRNGSWKKIWLASVTAVVFLLSGWEGFWRLQGFSPVVQDTGEIWAMIRRTASRQGRNAVALVGASRMLVDFHPDVFEEMIGIKPLMLAIDGSNLIPVLENLAGDPSFAGNVICSIAPLFLGQRVEEDRASEWVREYREQMWSSRIEARLYMLVQQSLVFRYTGLSLSEIWSDLMKGSWPKPPFAPMRPDRYRPADYSKTDIEKLKAARIKRERELHYGADPLAPPEFMERVKRLDEMAERIQKRGGQTVFVRFPSSGAVREVESETFPRSSYWDVFAANTRALTIHFEDYPSLSGFQCPEGSHLDVRDARRFTRALVEILRQKHWLSPPK